MVMKAHIHTHTQDIIKSSLGHPRQFRTLVLVSGSLLRNYFEAVKHNKSKAEKLPNYNSKTKRLGAARSYSVLDTMAKVNQTELRCVLSVCKYKIQFSKT